MSINVKIASGLLNPNINAATGVNINVTAEIIALVKPNCRFTAEYNSQTEPTPANTLGSSIEKLENPNSRALSPIIIVASGGLSIET